MQLKDKPPNTTERIRAGTTAAGDGRSIRVAGVSLKSVREFQLGLTECHAMFHNRN